MAASQPPTCPICVQAFTAHKREAIACPFCEYEACMECCERFLLEGVSYSPRCMSCKAPWNQDFVDKTFPKAFLNGRLKLHRKRTLLEREKSLLPSSTVFAEREKSLRKRAEEKRELVRKRADLRYQLDRLGQEIRDVELDLAAGLRVRDAPRTVFVRPCPAADCRGYLTSDWDCRLCAARVCRSCHEILAEGDHECDPADVESAKALERETRPCPSCGTRIYRAGGCDQMWCTQCRTAFSWRTGAIESGAIHNPHYYQWVRERGHEEAVAPPPPAAPNECNNNPCPSVTELLRALRRSGTTSVEGVVIAWHRLQTHVRANEMPLLRQANTLDNPDATADLRAKYLLKDFDEKTFEKLVFKRHKNAEVQKAIYDIFEMFVNVSSDLLRRILQATTAGEASSLQGIKACLEEFDALRDYFNVQSLEIAERFGRTSYHAISDVITYGSLSMNKVKVSRASS